MALRLPTGTIVSGIMAGGRFASISQLAKAERVTNVLTSTGARVPMTAASRVTYETRIPQIIPALQVRCNAATHEEAQAIVETAKQYVPVDTGNLRDSIEAIYLSEAEAWSVGTEVEYAPYVEFGTVYQAPQPYLIPAIEHHRATYIANEMKAVEEACFA